MPPVSVRIPSWADPQNASVLDNWWERTARTLGGMLGAADPASQAMAIGAPLELPEGGPLTTLKAYHGSGADFDRFDPTKIGTGEGSQAFSYGHYAAQREPVAQGYKDAARRRMMAQIEQEPAKVGEALFDVQSAKGDTVNGKVPFGPMRTLHTREQLAAKFADGTYDTSHLSAPLQKQVYDHMLPPNTGKMYELNLHVSPDELLDWDKPLSQQSPKVREALEKSAAAKKLSQQDADARAAFGDAYVDDWKTQFTAGDVYREMGDPKKAAEELRQLGVKGTQFLDRASRAAGEGSRNYVIYPGNEHLIEIARKYGVSLPVAASLYKYQQAQQK